jgi:phage-related protein
MVDLHPMPVFFWSTPAGNDPVRELLKDFEEKDRKKIGQDIRTVQFGWPIGMPLVRPLAKGLHELRTTLPTGVELRVFFAIGKQQMVLLHAVVKKSKSTPKQDIELARKRLKELSR